MDDKKALNNEQLEKVNGGVTPELSAKQLGDQVYQEMFENVCEPDGSGSQPHDCSGLIF